MKHHETNFEEYISSNTAINIHPKLNNILKLLPTNIHQMKNVIFYGARGIGKYTQTLRCIKMYSPSDLKYEKKISIRMTNVNANKSGYFIKISDIHYEVDMSILGCNSRQLWHDIYTQIIDIISAKTDKSGIILCKNFNKISSDLLDSFYSYMQHDVMPVHIIYILITEEVSFIPDNILSSCEMIHMSRPTKSMYNKIIPNKIPSNVKLHDIHNIKNMKDDVITKYNVPHKIICDKIIQNMIEQCDMLQFRDYIYDIFIYNLNVNDCIWYIIHELIQNKYIKKEDISELMIEIFHFFKFYNNNYRPIYHLEHIFYYMISLIHGYNIKI